MDKGTRARLIKLIEALPEVEEMLSDWSDQVRRKRNHPNTIYRTLEEKRHAHGQPAEIRTKRPTGTSRKELLRENEGLRAHIANIEAARKYDTASNPIDIMIEANRRNENDATSSSCKKTTPTTPRRGADRSERKRYQRLENIVSQICRACENAVELELPTLTVAERDDTVAKLEPSATRLNGFIRRVKASPIRAQSSRRLQNASRRE